MTFLSFIFNLSVIIIAILYPSCQGSSAQNVDPSSKSKQFIPDSIGSDALPIPEAVFNDIGDVINLMVPETADVLNRIDKATSLKHKGQDDPGISAALVDLFGFGSKCGFPDENSQSDGSPARQKKQGLDFDSLLVVHSRPRHGRLRDVIRNTWGSPEQCRKHRVLLRFVMGAPRSSHDIENLRVEFDRYGDLLVGNFSDKTDGAYTLTSLLTIRWALIRTPCPTVKYFIYSDDYTFMRLDKLPAIVSNLDEYKKFPAVLGSRGIFALKFCPDDIRSQTLYLEREFTPPTCDTYSGCVLPFRFASDLYKKFLWKKKAPFDLFGIYLGFAAEEYRWKVRNSRAFSSVILEEADEACMMKSRVTARIMDVNLIQPIWDRVSDPEYMDKCQ